MSVKPEQERFISSNLLCIAEVQFHPSWGAYALYHTDEMVGFVMYEHDEAEEEWWISSLMIAAEHQGKGYGRLAVKALIDLLTSQGCTEVKVGYAADNGAAGSLYQGFGFVELGLDDEGDMVSQLKFRECS
ncbi:MAG: GNAT family N-acetyltransferase [Gemmatimonadetes bacterium]|nr:GNAT family N-acetyltransferase [Gemmatimonadota bacterium]